MERRKTHLKFPHLRYAFIASKRPLKLSRSLGRTLLVEALLLNSHRFQLASLVGDL